MNIGIIGGGYVGLHTAIRLNKANSEWKIDVLEIDESKVDNFNNGNSPIDDYYMKKFMIENNHKLGNIKYLINENNYEKYDVVFISLSTNPSNDDETRLNTKNIFNFAREIKSNKNIPVVIRSTLNIDDFKEIDELNLSYWPEFLQQGAETEKNIEQSINVVSITNEENVSAVFKDLFMNKTMLYATSKEAILTKVMHNSLDAYLITLSNLFANISHENNIDFAKISPIVEQLLLNRPKVKKSGIGYGGSCYPKDSYSLINITKRQEDKELIESLNRFNVKQAEQFILFENEIRESSGIVVLGSSFKGGTNDTTKTPTIPLRKWLIENGIQYKIWEPQFVNDNLLENESLSDNVEQDIMNSSLVIVASDWKDFPILLKDYKGTVIDLKSCIPEDGPYKLLRIAKKS